MAEIQPRCEAACVECDERDGCQDGVMDDREEKMGSEHNRRQSAFDLHSTFTIFVIRNLIF